MPQEFILTVGAVLSSLAVIFATVYAVYKVARKIEKSIGIDSQGRTVSDRLDRVEHQLWENGGSSLADRVNLIETHVVKATTKMDVIEKLILGSSHGSCPTCTIDSPNKVRKTRVKKAS
jgi:hypothetical protein